MIEKLLIPTHPVLPEPDTDSGSSGAARMRVTESDLDMYAAIVGRAPSASERAMALEPVGDEQAAIDHPSMTEYQRALRLNSPRSTRSWSPAMICSHLLGGISVRVRHPQISAWVKRMSLEATRRLLETHARIAAAQMKQS